MYGALHPVLTIPIRDEDIEVTRGNVTLSLRPAPDGLTLEVTEFTGDP